MSSTDFTNNVTLTDAAWFDDTDKVTYAGLTNIGGTADVITATGPVGMSAYAARDRFYFLPGGTNTGPVTINITGSAALGARSIFHAGAACTGGEIRSGVPCLIVDDGTRFHLVGPYSGGSVPGSILCSGSVRSSSPTAGIGYAAGAGGATAQSSSKATPVILNSITGEITMNNALLTADTSVSFSLNNSAISAGDLVYVQHVSAGTLGAYGCTALAATASASVTIRNLNTGNLSEAIVLKYVVFKAVTA